MRASTIRTIALGAAIAVVGGCDLHRPNAPDGPPLPPPASPSIELRAAHGELVLSVAARGGGRFTVAPVGESPLEVMTGAQSLTVTRDGAVVLALRQGPTGFTGDKVRIVVPPARGALRVVDDIGVTRFAAEPRPGGGTLGRDGSGTPILEALAESDRLVVQRPVGGARLATVHRVPAGPDQTVIAAILAAPDVSLEARAAAVALVLSR